MEAVFYPWIPRIISILSIKVSWHITYNCDSVQYWNSELSLNVLNIENMKSLIKNMNMCDSSGFIINDKLFKAFGVQR